MMISNNMAMMIKSVCAMSLIHGIWIGGFGIILLIMIAAGLSNVVICTAYPAVMFYCLWFWYDRTERFIYRRLGVVRMI